MNKNRKKVAEGPPESVVIGATIGGATRRELVQNPLL